jgi:ribose-phosphate pyrophosphokinase
MLLLNGTPIESFFFPGGEIQVRLPEKIGTERVILTWKPTAPSCIMELLLTVNALNERQIRDIDIDILYLPYARQDRVCNPGEAFSLKVMCNLLNGISEDSAMIRLWDIHSAVVEEHLNSYAWHHEVWEIFKRFHILDDFDLSELILCAPDVGACERVAQVLRHCKADYSIQARKERDPSTGHITDITINLEEWQQGRPILVIDDICDGGATFLKLAEKLKEQGAGNLYLYVTHGIFSKGLGELLDYYKHIYCHHVLHDNLYKTQERFTILREFHHDN